MKGVSAKQTINSKSSIVGKENKLKELEKMFILKDDDFYEDDNESHNFSSEESPLQSPEILLQR